MNGRARILLVALSLALLGAALLPGGAAARKVANAGAFTATATSGSIRVKSQTFTFDGSDPVTFTGTIDGQGNVQVPPSGVNFPPKQVDAGGVTATVHVNPGDAPPNPVTGTLNPLTGVASLQLRVWIKIDNIPFGGGCRIASASSPIVVNALITGTTNPPGPNTPITGVPYNSTNGTLKVVNNNYSVPASSNCGPAGGQVDSSLGLPSSAGNNEAQFNLSLSPIIKPAIVPSFTATPSSGFLPLPVNFDASATTHTTSVQSYQWDFDGNGSFDRTTTTPTTSFTYTTPGTYQAKLRVTDSEGDFADTTRTVTVTRRPDLAITKSHSGSFRAGTPGAYTLSVDNSGGATTGTVTVSDTLPTGLTYQSATGSGWTCSAAGQDVTCTRGSIAAASTAPPITLNVGVTSAAVPSVINNASVSTANESALTNNTANDPTNVTAVDLALAKSHSGTFRPGAAAGNFYTLTVTSPGSAASFAPVTVTDTLPAELTYVSATGNGWSCNPSGQTVTCTHATPIGPAVAADPIILAVSASIPPGTTASVTNTATLTTQDDIAAANDTASDPTLIIDTPDLAIEKSHGANFRAGASGSYTLAVSNAGAQPTTGTATVTDTLPTGLTFVSAAGSGWSCSNTGQDVTCTSPDPIAADTAAPAITLTVDIGFNAIPSVTNTATVSTPGDGNSANDSDSDLTLVRAIDLAISKSHNGVFRVGQNGTYTITLTNVGSSETVGAATVTDTLPAGLTYVSGTGTGWSCAASGQAVTCVYSDPIPGGGAQASPLTLTVAIGAGAVPFASNTANVSTTDDFQSANDSSTDTAAIVEQDVSITKSHLGSFTTGVTRTYALAVDNVGTSPTTGATTVTDTLPAGLTFVSAAGSGWSCSNTGQDVTCTRSSTLAANTAAADISLRVSVGAAAVPTVTNTATVSTSGDRNPANDSSSDTASVGAPDVAVVSSHTGRFRFGAPGTYTLSVNNSGSGPTSGSTTVTDTLPAGLGYARASGPGWDCSASGQVVTCRRDAELAGGASAPAITLTVSVNPSAVPSVTNAVSVSTPGDGNAANDSATDPTGVDAIDLGIALSRGGPLAVGGTVDYTATVTNGGSATTVGQIRVADTLPTGLTPTSAAGTGWTCAITGQLVECERPGPLTTGAAAPDVVVRAQVGSAVGSSVTNTATVQTPDDVNPANDSASDTSTPTRDPDLALDLAAQPTVGTAFRVGTDAAYILSVRNVGGSPTTGPTTVATVLAPGLSYKSFAGSGWTCSASGQTVSCTRPGASPILADGRSDIRIGVGVGPTAGATAQTTATASTSGDANPANDSGSKETQVTRIDVRVVKSHTGAWEARMQGSYNLAIDNVGTAATIGPVTVTDVLPSGVTYSSSFGFGWTCSASVQTVSCLRTDSLAAGAQAPPLQVTVDVGDAAAPAATGTATISTRDDVNSANDSSTDTVPVTPFVAPPPGKTALPVVISRGNVKVTRSGVATIRLKCPLAAEVKCRGTLTLASAGRVRLAPRRRGRLALGRASYDVAVGRTFPVSVKLPKRARRVLVTLRRLRTVAKAAAPGLSAASARVTLRAP